MALLSREEEERYNRQLVIQEIGKLGQEKLKKASVLIVGTGGLGSPLAFYLAAAGVGCLGVVDSDNVELSNLQRQILHSSDDLGLPKAYSARDTLARLNPYVKIRAYHQRLNVNNVLDILKDYDVAVNAVDNFGTRYLVNDACVLTGKPLVEAGVLRFQGQIFTVLPGKGPCYRCIFPEPPLPGTIPSCADAGVLGTVPGIAGSIQATEVIKLIVGIGEPLVGKILFFDALANQFNLVEVSRNERCKVCGGNPAITDLRECFYSQES